MSISGHRTNSVFQRYNTIIGIFPNLSALTGRLRLSRRVRIRAASAGPLAGILAGIDERRFLEALLRRDFLKPPIALGFRLPRHAVVLRSRFSRTLFHDFPLSRVRPT
jgi:hypothetical protein